MKKIFVLFFTASISTFVLILFVFLSFNDHKLHLVICDVGQGDGIFIRTPNGNNILVDGGPDQSILDCIGSHTPFWDHEIEAIILTHPHADHLTGLIDVLNRYKVDSFYTEKVAGTSDIYKLLEAKLAEKNLTAKYLYPGDLISDPSGLRLTTLWPSVETIEKTDQSNANLDLNGLSVVELLKYGSFSTLLTGDAGINVEDIVAAQAGKVTILKVPHHGSKTGMDDGFLASIRPDLAVISVGAHNRYGHPNPISLKLLSDHGIKTLRTDLNGEIEIVSDGLTYSTSTKKQ